MNVSNARWKGKLAQVIRTQGVYGVLRFAGTRLFRLYRHRIFVCDLSELPHRSEGSSSAGPVEAVYLTTDEDLRGHRDCLRAMPRELGEYWNGIRERNTRGLLLLVDGAPAHSAFIMRQSRTQAILGFARDSALLGNDFTVPKYRRRGLHTQSVRLRLREAQRWGATQAVAETAMDNDFSARALTRGGMREVGSVTVCVVLNHFVVRVGCGAHRPGLFGYAP